MKILIAEDDPVARAVLRQALAEAVKLRVVSSLTDWSAMAARAAGNDSASGRLIEGFLSRFRGDPPIWPDLTGIKPTATKIHYP